MGAAGRLPDGEHERKVALLVKRLEKNGGRLSRRTIERLFDVQEASARRWRKEAVAAYRALHAPVDARAVSLNNSASRLNNVNRALALGVSDAA